MNMNNTKVNQDSHIFPSGLGSNYKHLGKNSAEQIKINQTGISLIRLLLEQQLTGDSLIQAQESYKLFQQIIDENRYRKLYTEE